MDLDNSEVLLKGRLSGNQKNRLLSLLDMFYTPAELSREIGFSRRQIYRVYIPAGCPHKKDDKGLIWINGKQFREWVYKTYAKKKLAQNEAFCMTCKRSVKMIKPQRKNADGLIYYLCYCPQCGRKLARIVESGKKKK